VTVWCLEMRNTQDWSDCRYREYTQSARRAEWFGGVPKIQFTDSGHGVVPHAYEHKFGRRLPRVLVVADHVQAHMRRMPR